MPGFGGASKSAPTGPTSLLKQEGIPEELRLPVPGDPMSRVGAGLVDLLIAGAAGASAGGVAQLVTGDAVVVGAAAQTAALGFWVLRDALSPDGNRSIGKRLFKLELAFWDGALPPTLLAAARNSYFLALPLSQLHPLLEMVSPIIPNPRTLVEFPLLHYHFPAFPSRFGLLSSFLTSARSFLRKTRASLVTTLLERELSMNGQVVRIACEISRSALRSRHYELKLRN